MADDRIEVVFGADIADLMAGVAAVKDQIAALVAPMQQLAANFDAAGASMGAAMKSSAEQSKSDMASTASAALQWSRTQRELGNLELADEKEKLTAEVQAGEISNDQKLAQLRTYTDAAYQLQRQSLQDEMALDSLSVAEKQRIYDQILMLDAKHQLDMDRLTVESMQSMQKEWQGAFQIIDQSMDTMLQGVLQGTQTWQQAMAKLFDNLALAFIEDVAKMMVQWAAFEALGALGFGAAATAVGNPFGAAATGLGGAIGGIIRSFDVGAWSIPQDMIAMVHAGEMILPAETAAMVRGGGSAAPMPGGAAVQTATTGAGAINVTFAPQIAALDGKSAVAALNDPATMRMLATNLGKYIAMNPSVRGAY